jgi:hypothetical protein
MYSIIIAPTILGRKLWHFAKAETKKWTCPQNKTIIFIFTMQTYKVKDLINVLYDNGIEITKYL